MWTFSSNSIKLLFIYINRINFLDSIEVSHARSEMIEFSKPDLPVAKTEPKKQAGNNTPAVHQRIPTKLTTSSTKRLVSNATASSLSSTASTPASSNSNTQTKQQTMKTSVNSTPVSSTTNQIKMRKASTTTSNINSVGVNGAANSTNKTLTNKKLKTNPSINNNKTGNTYFYNLTKLFFKFKILLCLN